MNMRLKWVIILCLLFLVIGFFSGLFFGAYTGFLAGKSVQPNTEWKSVSTSDIAIEGRVTKIVDGDTLDVAGERIRLSLVDTPERGESGFDEATWFTHSICPLNTVAQVDVDDGQPKDRFGRTVGVVYCNGKNLNAELWKNGHARIDERFLSVSEFDPYNEW